MNLRWICYNDRVKYIVDVNKISHQSDMVYICLDNKFHSWFKWDKCWMVWTVDTPNFPIRTGLIYKWMEDISR